MGIVLLFDDVVLFEFGVGVCVCVCGGWLPVFVSVDDGEEELFDICALLGGYLHVF